MVNDVKFLLVRISIMRLMVISPKERTDFNEIYYQGIFWSYLGNVFLVFEDWKFVGSYRMKKTQNYNLRKIGSKNVDSFFSRS